MRLKSKTAEIDRRCMIDFQKTLESAPMVVMSVGKHRKIDLLQIYPQFFCIISKSLCLPHIK